VVITSGQQAAEMPLNLILEAGRDGGTPTAGAASVHPRVRAALHTIFMPTEQGLHDYRLR
jgi:hypothetical protein